MLFEPTIDYVVTKIPRLYLREVPRRVDEPGPQMKSVGEVMAIGAPSKSRCARRFRFGWKSILTASTKSGRRESRRRAGGNPRPPERAQQPAAVLFGGGDSARHDDARDLRAQQIDPWFIDAIAELVATEDRIGREPLDAELMAEAKAMGFWRPQTAEFTGDRSHDRQAPGRMESARCSKPSIPAAPSSRPSRPISTRPTKARTKPPDRSAQGRNSGRRPDRIGQGIEFDYCCVHASLALKADGFETIMVNCNPETVSTDYDTSDRLYFEPLTFEDVMAIVEREHPLGRDRAVRRPDAAQARGPARARGRPDARHFAGRDRSRRGSRTLQRAGREARLAQPQGILVRSLDEAMAGAASIGYPVLIRPSYVLGGRAMEVVSNEARLRSYVEFALRASERHPLLIDRYLDGAIEVDVDAISDGETVVIGGIMEHVEQAGIHSGDSACVLPPRTLSPAIQRGTRAARPGCSRASSGSSG